MTGLMHLQGTPRIASPKEKKKKHTHLEARRSKKEFLSRTVGEHSPPDIQPPEPWD